MDVEGSEAYLLKSLRSTKDFKCDMIVEISNKNNAKIIYKHLKRLNLNFINLSNFKNIKIKGLNDMPSTYIDGFLIIKNLINFFCPSYYATTVIKHISKVIFP